MMNTGNMQGTTAPRGGAMGPQQMQNNQQQQQQQLQQQQRQRAIQQEVARIIQQYPVPPGWKSTLPLSHRIPIIIQLVTSLRLVRQMPPDQALQIAAAFERETLNKSADRATYDTVCREKLNDIHALRLKKAAREELQFQNPQNGQMNMGMQQLPMQNGLPASRPGQFPQGIPNPQLQRAMQPAPMPAQQQFVQNFNHQQQHLMNNNLSNPQMPMQPAQQGQNPSQIIPRPMTNNSTQLNHQETTHVMAMAHQMRSRASEQELESLRQRLASTPDETKALWRQSGVDPLTWYFRNLAMRNFQHSKARHNASQHQIQPNMMTGMGAQQPISMPQNAVSTAAPQFGGLTQGFDPSFGGNMQQLGNQIFGLQQDALRSQEEGQVVVPVSGNQTTSQQPTMQPTPQQQTMNQPTPARSMMNSQMTHQEKMQQTARMQAQGRIQNAGGMQNQMQTHQNNLQGQAGGLNGHMNQAMPQRSPAMPNLNRPLGPSTQQGPSQLRQPGPPPQAQTQDAGSAHQRSQQPPPGQSGGGDAAQLQVIPPGLQQKLSHLPPAQQQAMWLQWQKAMSARNQAGNLTRTHASGTGMAGPDFQISQVQPPQGHQVNQPAPGQTPAVGVQNFGNFDPSLGQPQNMPISGHQIVQGRPFEGQFRPQQPQQMPQSRIGKGPPPAMNDDQLRQMDQQPFPPNFMNTSNTVPPDVKRWGELKAWAAQNQSSMPPDIMNKLRHVQAMQFGEMVKRQLISQQKSSQIAVAQASLSSAPAQQSGPAPPAQMVGPHDNMPQAPNPNPLPMGMPPNMPAFQPPSAEQLRNFRIQNPQYRDVPDDYLRQQHMRQKTEQFRAFAQQRQNMNPQQARYENTQRAQLQQQLQKQSFQMNGQNGQSQPQPPATQAASHALKAATPLMGQGTMQESPHAQPSRSSVRPVQTQQSQKGTKRANEDDVVEVPNPKLAQQQQQRKVQPPVKQTSSQQKPSPSQPVRDTALPHQQQKQSDRHAVGPQNQVAQATDPNQSPIPPQVLAMVRNIPRNQEETAARSVRFKQIVAELQKNPILRAEVPMDHQTRNNTITFLMSARRELEKTKWATHQFFLLSKEEEITRDLLQSEMLFFRQYRGDQFPDRFTASLPELQEIRRNILETAKKIMYYTRYKNRVMAQMQQSLPVENSVGSANGAASATKAAPEGLPRQAPVLQRNHSNRENRAPAAPTSDKPPFSFGGLSPLSADGVPILYGPNQLTQDKLSLPPNKRRKIQNQSGSSVSSPAQAHGTPATTTTSPKVAKTSSPRVQRSNVAPPLAFKCTESSCAFAVKGFATMDDLNKHTADKHPVVEPPIEDPLEWALEGVRMGLGIGLDMNASNDGTAKSKELVKNKEMESERNALASVAMKKSASMQGLTPMRMEGGTPMSRMASQAGYQGNLVVPRTPQQSNNSVKTPPSDAKQSSSKPGQAELNKVGSASTEPSTPPNNPWKDTPISPSELSSLFPSPFDLQGLSLGSLTPASTLSSSKSAPNSPRLSDIDEGDMLNIRIEAGSWAGAQLPAEFLGETTHAPIPDDVWDIMTDPLLDMPWEDAFGKIIEPDQTTKEWAELTEDQQDRITPFDAGKFRWDSGLLR